jgi:hypothetical protein
MERSDRGWLGGTGGQCPKGQGGQWPKARCGGASLRLDWEVIHGRRVRRWSSQKEVSEMKGWDARKRWRFGLQVFLAGSVAPLFFFLSTGYVPVGSSAAPVEALCAERECACEDWSQRLEGAYLVENNVWNKGGLSDTEQCVFLEGGEEGVEAGWAWNWPGFRLNVVAYPSIVYGKKPWFPTSTTPSLPRRIGDLECLWADFQAGREGKGNGNLAFDLWLTEDEAAEPESITREVMIWLGHQGMRPAGRRVASLSLDGREAELWRREGHGGADGLAWTLLIFVYRPEVTEGPLDLKAHLDFLVENGYVSADEYLADVELGNEVVSGYGRTVLTGYEVGVCGR